MSRHAIYFTFEKISQRLKLVETLVYRRCVHLPAWRFYPYQDQMDIKWISSDFDDSAWELVANGVYWIGRDQHFVLRNTIQIPQDWERNLPVALFLPLGEAGDFSHPEALAYLDGQPYAACDRHHQEVGLPESILDKQMHSLALDGWSGLLENDPLRQLQMHQCALVQIDLPTRELVALTRVALGAVNHLDVDHPIRARMLNALDSAYLHLDLREPFEEGFYASVTRALQILQHDVGQAGAPLDIELVAAGHAHLDVAWLWTTSISRKKAVRTFLNALRLMETHPDFYFTQSQAQLYDFARQDQPALFAEIQQRIKERRWEPLAGMWVEADCNLTGDESLVRQLMLGRQFFDEHFSETPFSPVLWLPDAFGYCANLPQLIKLAGLEYFFTIKLSWNQYNRIPYDTFWWQGLDGTRVLTHFSPTPEEGNPDRSTYNAEATAGQVLGSYQRLQQKELVDVPMLMAYGYGDGGGGPTREMVENLELMRKFPSLPRTQMGRVGDFFEKLKSRIGEDLPVWDGELYLELHRGTYTNQAYIKQLNRECERHLHLVEFLATWAKVIKPQYEYPKKELQLAWQLACLNQFHDVLPGSSVESVYQEAITRYDQVDHLLTKIEKRVLSILHAHFGGESLVINPTSFNQRAIIYLENVLPKGQGIRMGDQEFLPIQETAQGCYLDTGELGPYAIQPLHIAAGIPNHPTEQVHATQKSLENDLLRVEFNPDGDICRILDKPNQREVLPAGAVANQFQAFEDRPLEWDAWDVDIFHTEKNWTAEPATDIEVSASGSLLAELSMQRRILHSRFHQRIWLEHGSPCLHFEISDIDWREKHILLKVAFPVDVLTPVATFDIQFGNIARPTHFNTSWDWARFETCAQKWVDLSEGGYGVSLLNDCKYGHDIHGNIIRLSLLRSAAMPAGEVGCAQHRFRYNLYPHTGVWDERTIASAYTLNFPVLNYRAEQACEIKKPGYSLLQVEPNNLVVETIKRAEDDSGLVVRLYESQRKRGNGILKFSFSIKQAFLVNLLEEKIEELAVSDQKVQFVYQPYQIITIKTI